MDKVHDKGARVKTPIGNGSVIYARMTGRNYDKASVYSVCLDAKKDVLGYSGTVFPAEQVKEE